VTARPNTILSREFRPAAIAIFTTAALAAFEGLAVSAALPEVAADLGSIGLLPWVITAFLLTSGITTVVGGPFIDSIGVSRVFRYAVVLFAGTGTLAAFAPTMEVMIALRIGQGAGAGLLVGSGLAAVALVFPQHLAGRAYAANSVVWGVMGVLGPAIAAGMLTYLDWRWIFLINFPLGIVSLAAGWNTLPGPVGDAADRRAQGGRLRPDVRGGALISVFVIALVVALDSVGRWSVPALVVAAAAGWLYLRHARSSPDPVVRLKHLFAEPYRGLAIGTMCMLAGAVSASIYIPLYVQAGRGASSAVTAWSVVTFSIGWTAGANVGGRMIGRWSESWLAVFGFGFTIPALAGVAVLAAASVPLALILGLMLIAGIGIGFTTNAGLTLVRAVTPAGEIGRASSVYQFARNQGFAFGAALGGAIILLVIQRRIGDVEAVRAVIEGAASDVGDDAGAAVRFGFAATAGVGAVVAAVGAVLMVKMRASLAPARAAKEAAAEG
jgi:MFS family permease